MPREPREHPHTFREGYVVFLQNGEKDPENTTQFDRLRKELGGTGPFVIKSTQANNLSTASHPQLVTITKSDGDTQRLSGNWFKPRPPKEEISSA